MKTNLSIVTAFLLMGTPLGVAPVSAAPPKPAPEVPLTEAGNKLAEKYTGLLNAARAEIEQALPKLDEQQKSAFWTLRETEVAAEAEAAKKQAAADANRSAETAVVNRKAGIEKSALAVAAAGEKVKQATAALAGNNNEETAKALKEAQAALDKELQKAALGADELKKAEEALAKAKPEEPRVLQELKAAQEQLAKAQADTQKALDALNLNALLADDKLDAALVRFVVLSQATPRGLAGFAQQGAEHAALVEKLLADDVLMKQMVAADGAKAGRYGEAMQIYTAIQKASTGARQGVLQRMALAVSLEHAVPVAQSNPKALVGAPATVDPVNRYLAYEKAFLAGELDPAFKDLTVWEYRYAINGDEPAETLAWGREMLRNYRPDHISTTDYRWRYVEAVRTEVKYGSQDVKNDLPTLQNYQNMIMNGGVCGRRAFFGRFILRCFGIPTMARPQPGHATLVHWTPDGWVICLGATWGVGKIDGHSDLDFLAMTQARKIEREYPQVQRAQWIGDALGEKRVYGFHDEVAGLWNAVALYRQRAIIEKARAVALAAVGTDIGEANESKVKEAVTTVVVSEADRKIVVGPDGAITIPAVACSTPTNSTEKIRFQKSVLGGMQLHHSRMGPLEEWAYTFEAPAAGKYALSARVVTTSADQQLLVAANDAPTPSPIAVPFTVGMWDKTPPVELSLVKGANVLHFSRIEPMKGMSIKDFTLTPVR